MGDLGVADGPEPDSSGLDFARPLLLSCYELGRQPQQLASAAAALERAGFSPQLCDVSITKLDEAAVRAAGLVVISVPMHTALRIGLELLPRVRALAPRAHICFPGLYAPLNAALVRTAGADSAVGEHEGWLVELAEALRAGRALPGLPAAGARPRIDVVPARAGLAALEKYGRLLVAGPAGLERRVAGTLEATRGCLHLCRHCPIPPVWNGRFVAVPVELVLEDARRQVAAGARHFSFSDPDFLNGPGHALAVARGLHAQHPEVSFDFTAKVEHLLARRALLPELAALGCVFIVSAVEALSPLVLDVLAKGHVRADVEVALAAVRAAGISLRPTFVPFTPWTTMADYLELVGWLREHGLEDEVDPVQLSIRLLLPPGSLLLERAELAAHLRGLDATGLQHRWVHPDPRLDALAETVTAICEDAAGVAGGEEPVVTFARIHAAAAAAAGVAAPAPAVTGARRRLPPPRLSEAWFCCAEPTARQLRSAAGT